MDSHLSRPIVANGLKPPPECGRADLAIKRSPPTVLLRIEFTAAFRLRAPGELLPRLSTLTLAIAKAVYFCCTCPKVAFGGRYPLSLPCGARTFLVRGLSALLTRLSSLLAIILRHLLRDVKPNVVVDADVVIAQFSVNLPGYGVCGVGEQATEFFAPLKHRGGGFGDY